MRRLALFTIAVAVLGLSAMSCVEWSGDSSGSTVDIPTTSQPESGSTAPAYNITLVDPLLESTAGAKAVAVGDIDNDGDMDFASVSTESQRVQIHLQVGLTGTFDSIGIAGGAPITLATDIKLADLNSDGKLDIVILVADTGFATDSSGSEGAGTIVMLFQGADPRDPADWYQIPSAGYQPPSNLAFPAGDGVTSGATSLMVGELDERLGPDIVVACNGTDSMDIRFFSNPGGAYATDSAMWISTTIEHDITEFGGGSLADLDSDGDLDIVLSTPDAKSFNLRWLQNPLIDLAAASGSGIPTYAADQLGTMFESTARAKALVLGDINGDGLTDLASISEASQPVQIHLRDAITGQYSTISITSGPPLTRLADIALVDLNADGKLDIVLLAADTGLDPDADQPALLFLLQGSDASDPATWTLVPSMTGSFPVNLLLGTTAASDLTVGDIDGVNGPDILVASKGAVRLFRNPGPASVGDAVAWSPAILETNASEQARIDVTDLDGDGDNDVVMADGGGSGFNVRWLQNPRISPAGYNPAAIPTYLSDLVRPDLIDPLFESTAGAKGVAIGDLNNDGVQDVVSISDENQTVQVHIRDGATGTFNPAVTIAGGGPLARMIDVDVVDLNNDGKLDITVACQDSGFAPPSNITRLGALVILIQGADPTDPGSWTQVDFTTDPTMPVTDRGLYFQNNAASITDMVTGDFTGDGLPDIVIASNEDPAPPHTYIYLFENPGAFNVADAAQWDRVVIDADAPDYGRLVACDVDLDGDLDVVASNPTALTFNLRWIENLGAGLAWRARVIGQQEGGGEVIAMGDIDNDGDLDLAVSSASLMLTQWFRNPGPIVLSTGAQVPWEVYNIGELLGVPGKIDQVQLVDLNGDGNLDCFVGVYDTNTSQGAIYGYQWQGDILDTWESFQIDGTGAQYGRVAFADFDGNGQLDFLAPLNYPGLTNDRIAFYTSVTEARWLRNVIGQQDSGADSMSVGDINGDGHPDVAVSSSDLGLTQWFKNPGPVSLEPGSIQIPWKVYNIGDTSSLGGGEVSQLQLVDLDGDGALDAFITSDGVTAAYRRGANVEDYWEAFAIDQTDATIGRVAFDDVDADGDLDFIAPLDRDGVTDDRIVTYLRVAGSRWFRRFLAQQPSNNGVLAVADVDRDGNLDVVAPTGNLTQWFRNPGAALLRPRTVQVPWEVYNIGVLSAGEPDQLQVVDLESNGTLRCFLSADGKAWGFQPQSNVYDYWKEFPVFTTDPVADIGRVGFADFNADGKLDFVAPIDRVDALVKDQFIIFLRK